MDINGFDSRRIHIFTVVAEEGSVTRAANRLALSQPAISQQIQRLEEAVESPLFIREPRGMRLTPAGERLLEHARRISSALEDAFDDVARHASIRTLRLGASTTVANHVLPQLLREFMDAQGMGPVELLVGNSSEIAEALQSGRMPLGIVEGPSSEVGPASEEMGGDEIVPVVATNLTVTWADVAAGRFPIIWREPGSGTRRVVEQLLRLRAGREPLPTDLVFGSGESAHAAAVAGLGVGFISDQICGRTLRDGALTVLEGAPARFSRAYSWAFASRSLSGRERKFYEWVSARTGSFNPQPHSSPA